MLDAWHDYILPLREVHNPEKKTIESGGRGGYVADELSKGGAQPEIDSCLKDFIDRVIVPALVREYRAQSRELPTQQAKAPHSSNVLSASSNGQVERRPKASDERQMLTISEAAAALGIKDATVRAWVSKRKITYVKLGRLVRIPANEIKALIERATIPATTPPISRRT